MREIDEVNPQPATELQILRHGIEELAMMAPGVHGPSNPCYGAKRDIKEYAQRIRDAADARRQVHVGGDRGVVHCGHDFHVTYRTTPDTAVRIGIGMDEIEPLKFEVYGGRCGVNGDPTTAELSRG